MSRPDLSIIVVSYNTRDLTLACLASIPAGCAPLTAETIVVDNASSDGSAEAIRTAHPEVMLMALRDNAGFARANNLAARQASADLLLLLNPDTVVPEGALRTLVEFARAHPQHGLYGVRTLFPDGSLNRFSCWGRPSPWSMFCRGSGLSALFRGSTLFDPESLGRWPRDTVREVDIVSGCVLLIRRDLWDRLNGFDERFHMYAEDFDLSMRAVEAGARPIICPEATIIHYGGASERVAVDLWVRQYVARVQLFAKHWRPMAARFGAWCLDWWTVNRMLGSAVLGLANPARRGAAATWWRVLRRRREWHAPLSGSAAPGGAR